MKGIKSVDFKVTAKGYGVVNWNGSVALAGPDGKEVNNHTLPKLRGFNNNTGKVKDNGYQYKKTPYDIDFTKNPMYISQNCIRHWIFKNQAFELGNIGNKDLYNVLTSFAGLVRGYVVAANQCKRTSPLLMEDFVEQWGNGNYEQFTSSSVEEVVDTNTGVISYKKSDTSLFSKTTFGETYYEAYGSISIEQLQFISLDTKFDRRSMIIDANKAVTLANDIGASLKKMNPSLNPVATFHGNYVRNDTIFQEGECGILLNDDAVQILVDKLLETIRNLQIKQGRGYVVVDTLQVDYNSGNMMRIKYDPSSINETKNDQFATYFYQN